MKTRWFILVMAMLIASGQAQVAPSGPPLPLGMATRGQTVVFSKADASTIITANTAITVFQPGTVSTGCIIDNTLMMPLYLDFTTTAVAGSSTAIPVPAGGSFTCPYPPRGALTAVAAVAGSFVAVRY